MKIIIIFLSVFVLCLQCVSAATYRNYPNYNRGYYPRYFRPNPYRQNYYNNPPVIYRNTVNRKSSNEKNISGDFSGLDRLEKQILSQNYNYDSVETRLERLENNMFGAVQSGSLQDRIELLQNASKSYKAYSPNQDYAYNNSYYPYRAPIFTGSTGSNWKNMLWGNFRNQLTGTPTGFTPAMDPAYMDYFEAERAMMGAGQQTDYRTNRGWGYSNSDRGSKTGVTILD